MRVLAFASVLLLHSHAFAQSCPSGTADAIEQYGITFHFDRAYACGRFANGDYWIAPDAPGERVRITAIDPAYAGERNGFEVNPSSGSAHGFDGRADGFDAGLVPALPYDAAPGESIVKTTSTEGSECRLEVMGSFFLTCLYDAAVLTVLDAPADRTMLFRPPYFGDDKPSFSAATMDLSWLPELASIPETPGVDWVLERYGRLQLDHKEDFTGRSIHPYNNMPDYGSDIGRDAGDAALALMLEADDAERRAAIVAFVQAGIDLFAMRRGGLVFSNGTHGLGRKLMLAFAARALGDSEMRALVADAEDGTYGEDTLLTWGEAAGRILWGMPCSEDQYWMTILTGTGSRFCADPYGYIDGGDEVGGYQSCCSSATWKGTALAMRLAPELLCVWNNSDLVDYVDRWVDHGIWAQPDPYAANGSGMMDMDPSDGTGRWPSAHGTMADEGGYGSSFAGAMWRAYRATAPPPSDCVPAPARDAGSTNPDAARRDGGSTPARDAGATTPPEDDGCGCSANGSGHSLVVVLVLALVLATRRRATGLAGSPRSRRHR